MAVLLAASAMAGCGSAGDETRVQSEDADDVQANAQTSDAGKRQLIGSQKEEEAENSEASENQDSKKETGADTVVMEDVSYVMIYNPYLYEESADPWDLYSGDFSSQIRTSSRAGGLEELETPGLTTLGQDQIASDLNEEEMNRDGGRAGGLDPDYDEGDTHEFYYGASKRKTGTFDCIYEGESCYVWTIDDEIDRAEAEAFASEFDEKIYPTDVETFGPARFTENGGKVNLLFYDMSDEGVEGLLGFFNMLDIFTAEEAGDYVETYGMNTGHAIVNINTQYMDHPEDMYATIGHELQHLICASDIFYYAETPRMSTWLNEAMSAYAEELLYPGSKDAGFYNMSLYISDNFRKGQSLYNFSTENDEYIGAYGAVYLYAEYLEELAGSDVFTNIHQYWRDSYSAAVTEAETLANVVPEDVYQDIDEKYNYSDSVSENFADEYEEWCSKLTLDFFLSTFTTDLANLGEYEDLCYALMQYNEVNPLDIEGGGRVIVETNDGTYAVPEDADEDLVYIGLDEDFNIVTTYAVND